MPSGKGSIIVVSFAKNQKNGKFVDPDSKEEIICMPCKSQRSQISQRMSRGSTWKAKVIGLSKVRKKRRFRVDLMEQVSEKECGVISVPELSGTRRAHGAPSRGTRHRKPTLVGSA